ncbi:MAG: hypothetical protein LBM23_00710 [Propionibacteriaceae bacterium]|nr:hypothetical protein [Propionibacteriaceae bacterium]
MYDTSVGGYFFGRSDFIARLHGHLDAVTRSGRGRIVSVRGRRQIGKSTVVERFVEGSDVPYLFFTGLRDGSVPQQLRNAQASVVESKWPWAETELLAQTASSWQEWWSRLAIPARQGPGIVVMDEFPWLLGSDRTLESELQVVWDRLLEKLPILMIVIGSDVSMMARLEEHDRPLYGRLRTLVLDALTPADLADALPHLSATEIFDAALVTGGYPRLVTDMARAGVPVDRYVVTELADPYSPLATTARFTLDAEFPEPTIAARVLGAIGADDTAHPGFNDVLSTIADPQDRKKTETGITRAIDLLMNQKRLIELETPAWAPPRGKLRRYRITDPYLRFWFRYLDRNHDRIARGRSDLAIDAFTRDWPAWRGRSVEPLVRASFLRLATHDDRLADVETVLPWWTRDGQIEIDVVAATAQRTAVVGSIKWRSTSPITERDMRALRLAGASVPRAQDASYAAISPHGDKPAGADLAFGADDLLGAWRL